MTRDEADFMARWFAKPGDEQRARPNRAQRRAQQQEDARRARRATRAYQRGQSAREEKTP